MPRPLYKVWVSPQARADMKRLYNFIAYDCFQSATADRYLGGIQAKIDKLAWLGGSIGINYNRNLQRQYGPTVRTVIYKKMSIIYNIVNNTIVVRSVISSNMIK